MRKRNCGAESGQILIIVALALMVLMGILALAVDVGIFYAQRRHMQNAADAGALAGIRVLAEAGPDGGSAAEAAAEAVARRYTVDENGAATADADADAGARTVTVTAVTTSTTFFARVLGITEADINARAVATYDGASAIDAGQGLYPIGVYLREGGFEFGQEYDIESGLNEEHDMPRPGNFGWLSWEGSPSVPTLRTSLTPPGDAPYIEIGDWVEGSTGKMSALNSYIQAFVDSPDPITIVVWDMAEEQGSHARFRVAGFAQFKVTGYRLNKGIITGEFVRWGLPSTHTEGPDYGAYGLRLIE
ncbi:MAG: pilus assembly protein TadG-related protein [Anaerolineae bacterium]